MEDRLARLVDDVCERSFGVATAVVAGEAVRIHLSAGADRLSEASEFEIGSITKTITGLLLAVLAERGVVGVDDQIGRWVDAGHAGTISLVELATHTSGLPRLTETVIQRARSSPDNPYRDTTAADLVADVRALPALKSGAQLYSNIGFMLLGHVLAVAADSSYEELVTAEIFGPLGMVSANFGDPTSSHQLPGYRSNRVTPHWDFQLNGTGGIEATIRDMSAYLVANLNPDASPIGGPLQLAQGSIGPGAERPALGWSHQDSIVWHSGGTYGFGSFIGFDRKANVGVVVLSNASYRESINRACFELLQELRSA